MPRIYEDSTSVASTARMPPMSAEKLDKSSLTDEPEPEAGAGSLTNDEQNPWLKTPPTGNHGPGPLQLTSQKLLTPSRTVPQASTDYGTSDYV